ncbi:MAG: hypothetical protein ACU0B9_14915 [Limimaricola soesokkakensis]|uniref:hypothetical protein n=1 Tax=Limimaricola soesokkakensis TaxID=1343159 RepID=UPI0040585B55
MAFRHVDSDLKAQPQAASVIGKTQFSRASRVGRLTVLAARQKSDAALQGM